MKVVYLFVAWFSIVSTSYHISDYDPTLRFWAVNGISILLHVFVYTIYFWIAYCGCVQCTRLVWHVSFTPWKKFVCDSCKTEHTDFITNYFHN